MRRIQLTRGIKLSDVLTGDKGAILRVLDHDAKNLVAMGFAVHLDAEPVLGPPRAELEALEAARLAKDAAGEPSVDEPEEVKRPYGNAPKSAWVHYACSVDPKMTQERGDGMTKADLMAKYGERL